MFYKQRQHSKAVNTRLCMGHNSNQLTMRVNFV